ncbi:helix-turn-helix domain-containing protein [Ruminococcus sp.]|uniref:helix-turn-helix domain-containing protein n=1 Tax=Ruminococcus sp. TaxID=41978 RepID=UPI0025E2EDE7|nr:helix-turn-helix domain-containing protein [Ruminococcus sp.]
MDQKKTGQLIKKIRIEKNFTQKQLAELLNVSDKTVSKWERGNGCPDISLLPELASVLEIDISILLSGDIEINESEKGNMKKQRFYVCPKCGNIITSTSDASISCCGSKIVPLEMRKAAENERFIVEDIGGELYIHIDHEMTKEHYISFVAYLHDNKSMIFKQYPEWNIQITMPLFRTGKIIWYCTKHGLMFQNL